MSKTSSDRGRRALSGPTMGTRWSALFHTISAFDPAPVRSALQAAVDEVDEQMSGWKPDSDLMRLNAGPVGRWMAVPEQLMKVLGLSLEIGRASAGAFDIGMGDAVGAWASRCTLIESARMFYYTSSLRDGTGRRRNEEHRQRFCFY
ncbi:MAG: FAD:protein FMN transferase [Bosea sp.]|nr:FAD:protein FMN transferase [Bosea sp. (in: a-proteobacteria)]